MKIFAMLLFIAVILFSCGESKTPCECMKTYEIWQTEGDSLQTAMDCLLAAGVKLDLNDEETGQLIYDLEADCPIGSRKLWKLCSHIEEGEIDY